MAGDCTLKRFRLDTIELGHCMNVYLAGPELLQTSIHAAQQLAGPFVGIVLSDAADIAAD
ncbi:hypothetical protein AQ619_07200 [Caulobacter henricii]|uniref:Uncharacterized protein n=1 Tax=Caulobacter henricii TaxID=69395 RepID=A0A0P0NYE6_9CAUL|nr:hypothetical protein AQ619_07200 [Caulobacter henricii]